MSEVGGDTGDNGSGGDGDPPWTDAALEQLFRVPANDEEAASSPVSSNKTAALACEMFKARKLRSRLFNQSMFGGEGAWDILLALYIMELQGRRFAKEELASLTGLPDSAATRWLGYLEFQGLVCISVGGAAISFRTVRLTPSARVKLDRYFALLSDAR